MPSASFHFALITVLAATFAVMGGLSLGLGLLSLWGPAEERMWCVESSRPWRHRHDLLWVIMAGALALSPHAHLASAIAKHPLLLALLASAFLTRIVAVELRAHVRAPRWLRASELLFGLASASATFLLGALAGELLCAPLATSSPHPRACALAPLNPFALLTGLVAYAGCGLHGILYLRLAAQGPRAERLDSSALGAHVTFLALFAAVATLSIEAAPFLVSSASSSHFWLLAASLGLLIGATPIAITAGWRRTAFLSSSITLGTLAAATVLFASGTFPS